MVWGLLLLLLVGHPGSLNAAARPTFGNTPAATDSWGGRSLTTITSVLPTLTDDISDSGNQDSTATYGLSAGHGFGTVSQVRQRGRAALSCRRRGKERRERARVRLSKKSLKKKGVVYERGIQQG
jgi:hypothetical protein